MKSINQRLKKIAELSESELDELEDDIQTRFDAADEADDVETMETMVSALEQVHAAHAAADDAAEPKKTEKAEPKKTEQPKTDPAPSPGPDAPQPPAEPIMPVPHRKEPSVGEPYHPGAPPGEQPEYVPEQPGGPNTPGSRTDREAMPVAASADFSPPADRRPVVAAADTHVYAGGDIPGYSAGSEFRNLDAVNEAFAHRLHSVQRAVGGDGEQHVVATVVASIPADRQLEAGDAAGNARKIEEVTGEQAIIASGGYCAPLPVSYDIFGMGSGVRPLRDSLPSFGANRGGMRFVSPPKLGDYTAAISLWTAANDANPTAPTTKPCLKVNCAAELTATADAVTLCLTFGNLMSRAFPELVARHNQLALIQHARFAEQTLLNKIGAQSTAITSDFKLGFARDFLLAVGKAAGAYRNRHRVSRTTNLRVIAPEWLLDAIREDIAQGLPGDKLATADSVISSYLTARNVSVTWYMDDLYATQGAGAMVDFPSTVTWYLFAEGTFLFLDGGTLDLGIVRDSGLVATNDYKTFVETFEGIAMVGLESIKVTTTSRVEGAVIGTRAPALT